MIKPRIIQAGFGLAVTCLFVWLIARQLDGAEVWASLRSAKPGWLAAGVAMFLCAYAARVQRWQLMLRHSDPTMT